MAPFHEPANHQFSTFWPALYDKGIYVVEDTHTSYWPGFEGGYKNPNSFVNLQKI